LQSKKISLPVKCKVFSKQIDKEAPLCIRMEASYMAETAVAIPFFAGFMALLLFFFQVLMIQQEVGNALYIAGRELSVMESRENKGSDVSVLAAKALLMRHMPKESVAETFVRGGKFGISLGKSDLSGDYIRLQADYGIPIPFGLFGRQEIKVTQKLKLRKWTGSTGADGKEEMVYITPTGSVYHKKKDCSYLRPSVKTAQSNRISDLRNADGGKYYSCPKCIKQKNENNITVFITEYGNRYHGKRDCSKLKRTVFTVPISEIGDRRTCSKCGGE